MSTGFRRTLIVEKQPNTRIVSGGDKIYSIELCLEYEDRMKRLTKIGPEDEVKNWGMFEQATGLVR